MTDVDIDVDSTAVLIADHQIDFLTSDSVVWYKLNTIDQVIVEYCGNPRLQLWEEARRMRYGPPRCGPLAGLSQCV
jgi:hypothetical protein